MSEMCHFDRARRLPAYQLGISTLRRFLLQTCEKCAITITKTNYVYTVHCTRTVASPMPLARPAAHVPPLIVDKMCP